MPQEEKKRRRRRRRRRKRRRKYMSKKPRQSSYNVFTLCSKLYQAKRETNAFGFFNSALYKSYHILLPEYIAKFLI